MSVPRSKFAGGDQAYLRHEQYRDAGRLAQRASLHTKYQGDSLPWFDFVRSHLDLEPGQRVLDVGCGPGWLWKAASVPVDLMAGRSVAGHRGRGAPSSRGFSHHLRPPRAHPGRGVRGPGGDDTVMAFGPEPAYALLHDHFTEVCWYGHPHELRCTDPADVMAYLCSMPPAEDADAATVRRLADAVEARFAAGGGVLSITADPGCFVCRR